MKNSMSEALRNRKSQGLDLTITIDAPEGVEVKQSGETESEKLGLAPEAGKLGGDENRQNQMADGNEVAGQVATTPNDSMDVAGQDSGKEMIMMELAKAGLGRGSIAGRMKGNK